MGVDTKIIPPQLKSLEITAAYNLFLSTARSYCRALFKISKDRANTIDVIGE